MAWTIFEEEQLRVLKRQGIGNEAIARRLHKRTQEVCDRVAEQEFIACECCKRSVPLEHAATYDMPNGEEAVLCAVCGSVADFISSYE